MRNSQPNVIGVDLSVAARVAQLRRHSSAAIGTTPWCIDDFKNEGVVASSSWPFQVNLLETDKKPVASTIPEEGATETR